MNKVQAIYDYTTELLDLLENKPEKDRDEKIRLINDYLEKREIQINELIAPFTDEEIELGVKIINLNKRVKSLLEQEKLLIQKDIKELHEKKKSTQKYSDPYQNLLDGGVFYDKRK